MSRFGAAESSKHGRDFQRKIVRKRKRKKTLRWRRFHFSNGASNRSAGEKRKKRRRTRKQEEEEEEEEIIKTTPDENDSGRLWNVSTFFLNFSIFFLEAAGISPIVNFTSGGRWEGGGGGGGGGGGW